MASVVENSPQRDFKGVQAMVDEGLGHVPQKYIRLSADRPSPAKICQSDSIPVIDFSALVGEGREDVLQQIRTACRDWGFFQLINHGVSQTVVDKMRNDLEFFFHQPAEERMRFFTENPLGGEVVYMSSASRGKEQISDWMDSLRFRPLPPQAEGYKEGPECCRDAAQAFYKEMRAAGAKLSEAICESLGLLPADDMRELLGEGALAISANYYPPCPDPSLTLGLSGHSDANSFTIVFQDEVGGLQVLKDDRWVVVQPTPGALVVNVADVIEILTNGNYKSIEHRVVTNASKWRMSIACFFGPAALDSKIEPQQQFVKDNPNRKLFRQVAFGELLQAFFREALPGKSHLSQFYSM